MGKILTNSKEINLLFFVLLGILIFWYSILFQANRLESIFIVEPSVFYFKPYISIYLNEILTSVLNASMLGFICIVIIPFFTLILIFRILNRFINDKASFLIALLSLSVYNNINLRGFVLDLFKNQEYLTLSEDSYLLIFRFPFPSLSILCFLILLNKILDFKYFEIKKSVLITILCSIYFYINAIDSLFILFFWFLYLLIDLRNDSNQKVIFLQLVISFLIVLPGIYFAEISNYHDYSKIEFYNITLYNIAPLLISTIFFLIKRIDIYEVWYKFKYIYFLLFIEIMINYLIYFKVINIKLSVLNQQVLQFPIHMMYFLPIIYYALRQPYDYKFGFESKPLSKYMSKGFYFIVDKSKNMVYYFLLILIYFFIFPKNM